MDKKTETTVVNLENQPLRQLTLDATVFGLEVNETLVHQVLKAQLAGARQGTAKTKIKSEVRGGGRKPFKQKGTGNARQGSIRSPLQPGGGQNFGPIPRSYKQYTPKQMVQGALRSILSDRFQANRVIVVDAFLLEKPRTAVLHKILKDKFKVDQVLVVDDANENLELSAGNLPRVKVIRPDMLNVYDVIRNQWVLVSERSVAAIERHLTTKVSV
jgi:large subunit ribosomal protein L4